MTRVVRDAVLLCAGGILVASAALANVPDPANCTLGSNIANPAKRPYQAVEGFDDNTGPRIPDKCTDGTCGDYEVTVKDGQPIPQPINNSAVVIDYSGCPDIQVSCDQLTVETGQINLGGKKVQGNTNSDGKFTFKVQGAANAVIIGSGVSAGTSAGTVCSSVYADGVFIGNGIIRAYDVDGLGSGTHAAVSGNDASVVAQESAKNLIPPCSGTCSKARDDYDLNNAVNGGDASASAVMAAQNLVHTGSAVTAPFIPSCP